MHKVYITGSGLWVPPNLISNDELVAAYNEYAKLRWKKRQSSWINSPTPPRPAPSSLSTSTTQTGGQRRHHLLVRGGVFDCVLTQV